MDMNRRSFFGVLGGALTVSSVALGAVPFTSESSPVEGETLTEGDKKSALRIDEWDEGNVHMIHIETDEDVKMGVSFAFPSGRAVHIPMIEANVEACKTRLSQYSTSAFSVIISHHCTKSGHTRVGMARVKEALTVDNMYLNIPVRFTIA